MLNFYHQTRSTLTSNVCCVFLRRMAIHEIALSTYRNILLCINFAAALIVTISELQNNTNCAVCAVNAHDC